MGATMHARVIFEGRAPILRVERMEASLRFYVDLLGFTNASWGDNDFTHVSRDKAGIYLCRAAKAAAERGYGSVWKRSKSYTRNTSRAE